MNKHVIGLLVIALSFSAYAKDEEAHVYFKGKTFRLEVGLSPFYETGGGGILVIPEKYEGSTMSGQPAPNALEGDPLHFKVKKAGVVTILISERSVEDFKKDEWVVVDHGIRGALRLKIMFMEKHLEEGEYDLPNGIGIGTRLIKL